MDIKIRKATQKDFPILISLIKELAAFEKASDKVTNNVQQMIKEKKYFEALVAEVRDSKTNKKEIIGMAIYFFAYYTWVGKSLYLDDIYVKESYRGKRIGTKLLKEVFKIAKKERCNRIRWQVLDWNKPAIDFYTKQGAVVDKAWYNCDFDKKFISKF